MGQELISVFDGKINWTYNKKANHLSILDPEKFPELKEKLTGKYESPVSALYIPYLLATAPDKLHIETGIKNGRTFYRIEIADIGEWEVMPGLNLRKAVIWIDADTLFPRKTEFYGEDETSWIKGSFADISLEPLPDTLFKIDVPPDASIDDPAERVGKLQKRGECISTLKVISMGLIKFAQDNDGRFPKSLSELYPKYVPSLKTFICPSTHPQPTESDIKENFNLSYEYVPGLNINSPHGCPIVFDKEDNHKDGRNAAFVDGSIRWITKAEWQEVYRKHQERGNND